MSLKFTEKNHGYYLDGKRAKSVTTLISGGIPKPALMYWSAKAVAEYVVDNPDKFQDLLAQIDSLGRDGVVNALKNIPWQTRNQAAVKGTQIHHLAEQLSKGEEVEVTEDIADYVQGYVDWLDRFQVEPILTERTVANRKVGYCGRFDLIAKIGSKTWLIDYKTSNGVYGEVALQNAAYASAEFYVSDDDVEREVPLPKIDKIGVAHITEHGTFLYDLGNIRKAFKFFKQAKAVAESVKEIEDIIGEPLEAPKVKKG
jgi:hypothetical protein